MPQLHLPRASYDLFVYDFGMIFCGIVVALRYGVCVYILYDYSGISFGERMGQY